MSEAIRTAIRASLAAAALLLTSCHSKDTGSDQQSSAHVPAVARPVAAATDDPSLALRNLGFDSTDTDHDGRISSAEYAASSSRLFAAMDIDRDGLLTADEMGAARNTMRITNAISPEKMIAQSDNDGDGELTLAEFIASVNQRFTAADKDGNGLLTPAEFVAGHPELPSPAASPATAAP